MIKVGDKIRITECSDPYHCTDYVGREGTVTNIGSDPFDKSAVVLYGTWGGCSISKAWGDRYELI